MDQTQPHQPQNETLDPIATWQAYFRTLQKLQTTHPNEYEKVPEILKHYTPEQIGRLTPYDIQALQTMNALPQSGPEPITHDTILAIRAYLRTLQKLKDTKSEWAKVPAVLQNLSDDEIENLDTPNAQALQTMNVFPAALNPQPQATGNQKLEEALEALCASDPELQALAKNPETAKDFAYHPKIIAFLNTHPDLKKIADQDVEKGMDQYFQAMGIPVPPKPTGQTPYTSRPYGTEEPTPPIDPIEFLGDQLRNLGSL